MQLPRSLSKRKPPARKFFDHCRLSPYNIGRRVQRLQEHRKSCLKFKTMLHSSKPSRGQPSRTDDAIKDGMLEKCKQFDEYLNDAESRLKVLTGIPPYLHWLYQKLDPDRLRRIDSIFYRCGGIVMDLKKRAPRFGRDIQSTNYDIPEVVFPLQRIPDWEDHFDRKLEAPLRALRFEGWHAAYMVNALALKGRSATATIYSAVMKSADDDPGQAGTRIAVKEIPFELVERDGKLGLNSKDVERRIYREAILWSRMQHKHILRFTGIWATLKVDRLFLVSRWVEYETLDQYLKPATRHHTTALLKGVIAGLAYLHSGSIEAGVVNLDPNKKMKLYHGDIYRSNVFVDKLENGDPIALLGDFGQSGDLESESNVATFMSERPFHIAPELYKHFVRSNLRRTTRQTVEANALIERIHLMEKGDVYALGILAWEMYTGAQPFTHNYLEHKNKLATATSGAAEIKLQQPQGMPDALFQLIQDWTNFLPEQRPNMAEVEERFDAFERLDPPASIDFDSIAEWVAQRRVQMHEY